MTDEIRLLWRDAWPDPDDPRGHSVFDDLAKRLAEPHRHYHTMAHVIECLRALSRYEGDVASPQAAALAVWFHDAVYDPRAHDNEEQSAALARRQLEGVYPEFLERVVRSILVTKHQEIPEAGDEAVVHDVDLAILGSDETRFSAYEDQVRQEYAWVSEPEFRAGRKRVLGAFLARPRIYATAFFAAELEAKARGNLLRSIDALS